jgi:hypothetical protein
MCMHALSYKYNILINLPEMNKLFCLGLIADFYQHNQVHM